MVDINAKAEYFKAKGDLLQYALHNVETFEKLYSEMEPGTSMRESYRATVDGWRLLIDELATIF